MGRYIFPALSYMIFRAITLTLFFLIVSPAQSVELRNQLADHPAPYLALHGSDPVAWQTWNSDVMELARQQKPLVIYEPGGAWMWLRNQNLFRGLYRKTGRIEAAAEVDEEFRGILQLTN